MKLEGFIGPSYTLQSRNVDAQRCINLYPEANEMGRGKDGQQYSLVATPGLNSVFTLGDGPIRGLHTASNGNIYACSGTKVYKVESDYTTTLLGSINSFSGQVSFADNGTTLCMVDGVNGWLVTLADDTFSQITDTDFNTADQVVFLDGYFVFNEQNTGRFFISSLQGTDFDALDFATAEGAPDNIVGLIADHRDLWIFGEETTEVYYNSGNADFPFERSQGAFIEQGCAATFSIAKMNNEVYWVSKNDQGQGVVYKAAGFQPQRISTHAVENAIRGYADISTGVGYTYQENGHYFYVLNFEGAETTWVYDSTTGLWHERAYLSNGNFQRHRGLTHTFAFQKHFVGDRSSNNVYEMSSSVYTDNGDEILRQRSSPHISSGEKRIFYHSFQLDMETGTGLDGASTVQGHNPQAMLQWSDDGGWTWSNELWQDIGKIGDRKVRLIWRRLGRSRDRIFRVRISDPNRVTLIGAEIDITVGAS